MRIQHNIMAMNSYRNYSGNTTALSKNLEKLSSGYKINRAGDDAAGLAISEKMRAQISGLDQAQSNAKSGINLVQTAEGALTEVHSMLNRMVTLADQSANGTFDNETDRANLQKEVTQLKSEIDRIADSSNFNGIKLLDGSLSKGGSAAVEVTGTTTTTTAGTKSTSAFAGAVFTAATVDGMTEGSSLSISMSTEDGQAYTVSLTKRGNTLVDDATGDTYGLTSGGATQGEVDAAVTTALGAATNGAFKATLTGGALTMTSTATGTAAKTVSSVGAKTVAADGTTATLATGAATITRAEAEKVTVATTASTDGSAPDTTKASVFSINNQKFVLAASDSDVSAVQAAVGDDVKVIVGDDLGAVAGQLAKETGLNITKNGTTATSIDISTGSGKALTLQIGDTSESFNKMSVGIQDMHTSSLGIGGIDISTQAGASRAVDAIKSAINSVSSTRGTLGALQNRLDHTINNLGVMQENIQDAESTVRDTDVAKEMMAYTKNNILVQSAQAMLAQANQVPQGVLQLLQ